MYRLIIMAMCVGFLGAGSGALAEDAIDKALKAVDVQETALLKDITPEGQDQFQKINVLYRTLGMVGDTRVALDRGIKNCIKHHKDQAFGFQNQFQAWKNEVLPVIRQGQNRLDKMILTQTFAKPAAVQDYLKTLTASIFIQNNVVQEIPVSDLDACQAMVDQMKKTQKTMVSIMKETLMDQNDMPDQTIGAGMPPVTPIE